jgi:hypothetical protein
MSSKTASGGPSVSPSVSEQSNIKDIQNIRSILVTHNSRLRCLLMKLFNKSQYKDDPQKRQQFESYRLQNCCVLKLILIPQYNTSKILFNLMLLYSGEIEQGEEKAYDYWSTTNSTPATIQKSKFFGLKTTTIQRNYHIFDSLSGKIDFTDLNDIQIQRPVQPVLLGTKTIYTFYLVRHGQAEHNLYTGLTILRKTDTSLTGPGKTMAVKAGQAINTDLKPGEQIQYYFRSDLIRTGETFKYMLNGIDSSKLTPDPDSDSNPRENIKITQVVIQCSHELDFKTNGKCDEANSFSPPENNMSCTKLNAYSSSAVSSNEMSKYTDCVMFDSKSSDNRGINVNIKWPFYSDFYGNSYRGSKSNLRQHCRNTSMITECIKYIIENQKTRHIGLTNDQTDVIKTENKDKETLNKYLKDVNGTQYDCEEINHKSSGTSFIGTNVRSQKYQKILYRQCCPDNGMLKAFNRPALCKSLKTELSTGNSLFNNQYNTKTSEDDEDEDEDNRDNSVVSMVDEEDENEDENDEDNKDEYNVHAPGALVTASKRIGAPPINRNSIQGRPTRQGGKKTHKSKPKTRPKTKSKTKTMLKSKSKSKTRSKYRVKSK